MADVFPVDELGALSATVIEAGEDLGAEVTNCTGGTRLRHSVLSMPPCSADCEGSDKSADSPLVARLIVAGCAEESAVRGRGWRRRARRAP